VVCGGLTQVRARASAFTSGTVAITWDASLGSNVNQNAILYSVTLPVGGPTPVGIAPYSNPELVGGINSNGLTTTLVTNTAGALTVLEQDLGLAGSYPAPLQLWDADTNETPSIDAFGNLTTRGPVFTDEGSLRDDFSGTTLTTALTGTLGFTNGSTTVTGVGTSFTTQVAQGAYIAKSTDTGVNYAQVAYVISNTQLVLSTAYAGTTASGVAGVVSNWQPITGTGASVAVASSICTITAGTTANAATSLRALGDYPPYSANFYMALSQRIANQTFYAGFQDVVGAPNQQATVQFSGTSNTTVNFVTSYDNGSSIQTTAATIPNGGTTAGYHTYTINLSNNQATLVIDGVVVAVNALHLPGPYTSMYVCAGVINGGTAPASSTTMTIDYLFYENVDRVQIDSDFLGEALPVGGASGAGQAASGNPLSVGGVDGGGLTRILLTDTSGHLIPTAPVDKSLTGTLGALNAVVNLPINGTSSLYALISGTWVGTIQFQGSVDGTNFIPLEAVQGGPTNAYSTAGFTGNGGVRVALPAGFVQVQAKMTAYTSGTATVVMNVSEGISNVETLQFNAANLNAQVQGPTAAGSAVSGNPVRIGASDGTNVQNLISNPVNNGQQNLLTQNGENLRQTFSCAFVYTPYASPLDIAQITGSSSKTIRITRIEISGIATTAQTQQIAAVRRTAADTGGTPTTQTSAVHDSSNSAATAVVTSFGSLPTNNGTATYLRATKMTFPLSGTYAAPVAWDFGVRNGQPIVLRGAAQVLTLSLLGTTIAGGSIDVYIEWTEDNA